ncbi:thioredoxin [Thecamonas trahens ATCC 50062]|uniref:Thioredoxin n=1 Tax=Thecamonas trahens ATCC 50062 TaxID=461836 RepID=A0A0L0D2S6_THETB|nr:thioredoxin [Thecamonas trahens ATCC 50062]KNC46485.1 thioredoxin [Thecamonas trahens ATCC 50062]|eukprot:XP_013760266.1 thioredoxin [Thecamonas trahens ATCC 50062]
MDTQQHRVALHVYDLSNGLAARVSEALCGFLVEGIWHTGIVVYNKEYFYGNGIQAMHPSQTPYGDPVKVHQLGFTSIQEPLFLEFVHEFLLGSAAAVPEYITSLPGDIMATPLGEMIRPMIDRMMPATAATATMLALKEAGLRAITRRSQLVNLRAEPTDLVVASTITNEDIARMSQVVLPALADLAAAPGVDIVTRIVRALTGHDCSDPTARLVLDDSAAELMTAFTSLLPHAPESIWFALIDMLRHTAGTIAGFATVVIQLPSSPLFDLIQLVLSTYSFTRNALALRHLRSARLALAVLVRDVLAAVPLAISRKARRTALHDFSVIAPFISQLIADAHDPLRLAGADILVNYAVVTTLFRPSSDVTPTLVALAEENAIEIMKLAMSSFHVETHDDIALRRLLAFGRAAILSPRATSMASSLASIGHFDAVRTISDRAAPNPVKIVANELLFIGL